LTFAEMRAFLRQTLEDPEATMAERAAAAVALAETPGTDPARWYGRWPWSEGTKPLAEEGFDTSYTRLGTYDECGLKYVLQSVLGLDDISTHQMKFGTWIHAIFEAAGKAQIRSEDEALKKYHETFDDGVFPSSAVANNYRRRGERMISAFWKFENTRRPVAVEKYFEFPFHRATLRGYIDRIDSAPQNGLKLTDYKTSTSPVWWDEAKRSLQLAIYQLAAQKDEELSAAGTPKVARLVYPGKRDVRGQPTERTQSPEDAETVIAELPGVIDAVLSEDFAPDPDADCTWCRMKPLCPLWHGGEIGS
jgi:RecB family exonuclease